MSDLVPESAIEYQEVFRRGGRNLGDEDFALFKCPSCGRIYLIDYEVDTVYLDPDDLSQRSAAESVDNCVACGLPLGAGPWIGPKAHASFCVSWQDLEASRWSWIARRSGS